MIFCCVIQSKKMIVFLKNRVLKDTGRILFVGFLVFTILVSCNKVNNRYVFDHTQYASTRPSLLKTLISAALLLGPKVDASSFTQEYIDSDLDLDLKGSKGLLINESMFIGIKNISDDAGFAILSTDKNVPISSNSWYDEYLYLRSLNTQQNTEYLQDMEIGGDDSILLTLSNTHEIKDGTAIGFYDMDSKQFEMIYSLNAIGGLCGVNLLSINQNSLIMGGYNDEGILFAHCSGMDLSLYINPYKTYMLYNGKNEKMRLSNSVMVDDHSASGSLFFVGTHSITNNNSTHLLVGSVSYDNISSNVYTIIGPGKSRGGIIRQHEQNIILCEERQGNLTQQQKSIFIHNISFEDTKLTRINWVNELANLYNATCKDVVVNHSDIFISGHYFLTAPRGYISKLYSNNMGNHVLLEGQIKIFEDANSQYSEINNIYTYADNINFFGNTITNGTSSILTGNIDFYSFQNNRSCDFINLEVTVKDVTHLFSISSLPVNTNRGPYLQYGNIRSAKRGFSVAEGYILNSCDSSIDTNESTLEPTLSAIAIEEIKTNRYKNLYNLPDFVTYLSGGIIALAVAFVCLWCWCCKKRRDLNIKKIYEMAEIASTKNGLNIKARNDYSISEDLCYVETNHHRKPADPAVTTNLIETATFLGFEPYNDNERFKSKDNIIVGDSDEESQKLEEREEEKMNELIYEQEDDLKMSDGNDDLEKDNKNSDTNSSDTVKTEVIYAERDV